MVIPSVKLKPGPWTCGPLDPGNERAARVGGSERTSADADMRYEMMMIVAARREITAVIQAGFEFPVNVNSVQKLCAKGGQRRNFWGLSAKSADNPVNSKIPLDLRC